MRNSRQIWEIGRIVSEGDLKFEIVGYIFADDLRAGINPWFPLALLSSRASRSPVLASIVLPPLSHGY